MEGPALPAEADTSPLAADVPAILVRDVSKRYGDVVALERIDLTVPKGSILGLVGPNGAGKTTLIRILVGALGPDTGSIEVLGMDPHSERQPLRAQIGYMPQAAVLYQDLTVEENVTFFARGHLDNGVAHRVNSVLDFVDLRDARDRQVQDLSGGQRQRASLAAALVHEPLMLFLDEPTAGVDPALRHAFWRRFRELSDSGVTVIVSTHQMDEVVHCDRVALIRGGTILSDSTPRELFASAGATVRIMRRNDGVTEEHVYSPGDDLPRILQRMGLDPDVLRIEIDIPNLEDVVLGLIGLHGEDSP
jgi:ABC-2 type transport system ATP-binding protein